MSTVGYQGEKNCYTYKVIKKYLGKYNPVGFKNFNQTFNSLINNDVDYILLPIENSTGGSIYINYDLFYKYHKEYDIKIVKEFTSQISHRLYINKNSTKNKIKYVLSHPQALIQCMNNINDNNWESVDSWDTAGSINDMIKKGEEYACIAPPDMENIYNGIKPIIANFNDENINITRFYLITKKKKIIEYDNCHVKFSSYVIMKDQIGILGILLEGFKNNNINLTKIESRPLNGAPFKYIFFIEGIGLYQDIKFISLHYIKLYDFNILGTFPTEFSPIKIPIIEYKLKVGIIGFGRFGQFIGKKMAYYGFQVYCTSRKNYKELAQNIGITYLEKKDFEKESLDVVIFSTSIKSFIDVFNSYDISFWNNKLVCDVLSVKKYPFDFLKSKLENNILCTHPMFGPDSAKYNWKGHKFVYYPYNIQLSTLKSYDKFIKFWNDMGCELIKMTPSDHDRETADSQFITHFIGRSLVGFNNNDYNISTEGFNAIMKIKEHTINDSWDLFSALAKYNKNTKESIHTLIYNLFNVYNKLFKKEQVESSTSKIFREIIELKKTRDIINCGAGVPSWKPATDLPCEYSTAKGKSLLISNIINHHKSFSSNNNDDYYIKNENIIITPGAKPALYMLIKVLTNPGTKWVIPIPYWVSYGTMVEHSYAEPIYLKSSIDSNWECDLVVLENLFVKDNMNGIIISNPCNPTGHIYRDEYITNIKNLCIKYKKYFIIDEVYLPLTNKETLYDGNEFIISVNSFSKRWGIPGFRVGWILAEKNLIKQISNLQSSILTCTANASQEIAIKLLNEGYKPELTILNKSKNELSEILLKKGWKLLNNKYPSMYLFPIKDNTNIDDIIKRLLDQDLAVIHGNAFGIDNGFRMTLWNDDNILNRMKKILNDVL